MPRLTTRDNMQIVQPDFRNEIVREPQYVDMIGQLSEAITQTYERGADAQHLVDRKHAQIFADDFVTKAEIKAQEQANALSDIAQRPQFYQDTIQSEYDKALEMVNEEDREIYKSNLSVRLAQGKSRYTQEVANLERDKLKADFVNTSESYRIRAANAPTDEERAIINQQAFRNEDLMAEQGLQSFEQAEINKQRYIRNQSKERLSVLQGQDGIAALDAPFAQVLTPAEKETYRRGFENDVKRAQSKAQSMMNQVLSVTRNGDIPTDDVIMQARDAVLQTGDPQMLAELDDIIQVAPDIRSYSMLSIPEMQQEYQNLQVKAIDGGASRTEIIRRDMMEQTLKKQSDLAEKDPIQLAMQQGIDIGQLDTVEGFQKRAQAAIDAAQYNQTQLRIFTNAERDFMSKRIETATATETLQLVDAMARGFGNYTPQAMRELKQDNPVFTHMAGMAQYVPNSQVTVSKIAEGQTLLRENKDLAPDKATFQAQFDDMMQNAYEFMPQERAAHMESARALYAKMAMSEGKLDGLQTDLMESAIRMSITGSDDTEIGILERDGGNLLLPAGMKADEADRLLDGIGHKQIEKLSISGGKPVDYQGRVISEQALINQVQWRNAGNNAYYAYLNGGLLRDENGSTFIMRLK